MKSGDYSDYYSSIFMPKIKNGGFNMSIKITKKFLTNNDCYKTGRTIKPTGIVMHSTGCNQPNAQVFINTWNQSGVEKCVHAFVDANGIYQTLPFTMRCWGCASGEKGSFNNSHIQFEIAEDGLKDKEYFENVYNKAVDLCVYLCKEYNINPNNIVCHSEAHKMGYASNHADVMHWFPKHGKDMDEFRSDVKKKLNENNKTIKIPTSTISKDSTDEDILWLQNKLNKVAKALIVFKPALVPSSSPSLFQSSFFQ
jgi:N-acetylmuramoyl-L-alanine amidase CwlA